MHVNINGFGEELRNTIKLFFHTRKTDIGVMSAAFKKLFTEYGINDKNFKLVKAAVSGDTMNVDASTPSTFSDYLAKTIKDKNELAKKKEDEKKEQEKIDNNPVAKKSIKFYTNEIKDKSKEQIEELVKAKMKSAGFTEEEINRPVKHAVANGKEFDITPPKPAAKQMAEELYQLAHGMTPEEIAQKQQEENENAPEEQQTQPAQPTKNQTFPTERQLHNMEKYQFKASSQQEYDDAMQELADHGLLKDDPEEQNENDGGPEEAGGSWVDYLSPEEREEYENNKEQYGLEVESMAEYKETMKELEEMGLVKELAKDGPDTENPE